MGKSFHLSTALLALLTGLVFVIGIGYFSGSFFATPRLPVMGVLSGFIIMGAVAALASKQRTIMEPGLAAAVVAIVSFFVLRALELKGFKALSMSDMALVMCNGFILTWVGAWVGELLQGSRAPAGEAQEYLQWSWILCGTVIGVTISLVKASFIAILLGAQFTLVMWAFIVGLFLTGLVVGWKSPGVTIREGVVAGFLTVILDIDIVALTLVPVWGKTKLLGVIIGIVVTLVGAYVGEMIQKKTGQVNA